MPTQRQLTNRPGITWPDTVADWMASSRKGVLHTGLYPQDNNQWKTGS